MAKKILSDQEKYEKYYKRAYALLTRHWSYCNPDKLLRHSNNKVGRGKESRYKCEECGNLFVRKLTSVDHKLPRGPHPKNLEDFLESVKKLNCDYYNLQVLCDDCHKEKTLHDRKSIKEKKSGKK